MLLLQHARRRARLDAAGDLVTMEDQDRSQWDRDEIASGLESLAASRATGRAPGFYRLQAEIAALHDSAPDASSTDWLRIVAAYDALVDLRPSPVVALNRAIAIAFRDGPEAGLEELAAVEIGGDLSGYPLVVAVRADLLRRARRWQEAATAYRQAIRLAATQPEQRLLQRRLAELEL